MPVTLEQFGIDRLPPDDRLELIELLWDSLSDEAPVQVSEWHLQVLKERIAAADANPGASTRWEIVKARLLGES